MSEIDVQNSRQIRNPMDVLITMEVPDVGITLTYSGYSSAKVADGSLGNAWPMRLLADLKGDGFPLDGSRVVYNSATSASETNGKIGVRSNIGQTVSVTVTGSANIVSLSIFATGATSVTYNGTTSAIVGGQVIIPVGATSITLTFNPASATDRIEVSQIVAGTSLRITNDTLIKAVVSLRSDLSIIDPTLPESELNVEVYNDADISEIVASLPEDTPITYQAGYPGDMSPIRKFYVAGQVTWADNVLSIHAVDAVHFLEIEIPSLAIDCYIEGVNSFARTALNWLKNLGVIDSSTSFSSPFKSVRRRGTADHITIPQGLSLREYIAFIINVIRYRDVPSQYCYLSGNDFVLDYVDGGIPSFTVNKYQTRRQIAEEDMADIKKDVLKLPDILEADTSSAWVNTSELSTPYIGTVVGSASWIKDVGISVSFDKECYAAMIGVLASEVPNSKGFKYTPLAPIVSDGDFQFGWPATPRDSIFRPMAGALDPLGLVGEDTPNGSYTVGDLGAILSSFVAWGAMYDNTYSDYPWSSMSAAWNGLVSRGIIPSDAVTWNCDVYGYLVRYEDFITTVDFGTGGSTEKIKVPIKGKGFFTTTDGAFTNPAEAFPQMALDTLKDRSNITYAFTWKGDPRMQPRDVVEWQRLDGTTETITLENITLTHEKGGTVAEITARKGIV